MMQAGDRMMGMLRLRVDPDELKAVSKCNSQFCTTRAIEHFDIDCQTPLPYPQYQLKIVFNI